MKKQTSRWISLLLFALLVGMPGVWVSAVHAQAGSQGTGTTAGGMQQIQGAIQSVDPSGRMLTLKDGTQLTIPSTVNVSRADLKEGAIVKASFEERAGQNVVTSLEVEK
jgi:hypothetical protein